MYDPQAVLKKQAARLPAKYRKQILEDNVIYKAVAQQGDTHMEILFLLYSNYYEPYNKSLRRDCVQCLHSILTKFQNMERSFIQLEREAKLLDSI
ncbi:MAG: hypothetical protein EBX40_00610 [Gammaproteobacteria bacterium]|nr:hypothetical protein [Gammaproteobacteria bacterium]